MVSTTSHWPELLSRLLGSAAPTAASTVFAWRPGNGIRRSTVNALTTLVQSLGIAYASGISPYATVALAGIVSRMGWIDTLPGALSAVSHPAVIVLASVMTVIEFLATLIPGVASLWETVHTAIRPPAAAALAVLTAWHGDPALIAAAGLPAPPVNHRRSAGR